MVIYEVNLDIDPAVYNDFVLWHQGHMAELIALPGFEKAIVYRDGEAENRLSIQYHMKSMDALDHYSIHYASKLRAEAEARFPQQFKAVRRILKKESMMEA